ncbi:ECF RNA polymerase sigma factor SigL [Arthrobacter ulcerisalmonis]|uniref:ECF RNA polymerase sigma factor SigL n=2 Tax=Arthrobacter ulcerisalmonis TaxID=2483813 RepID=A0A3P5WVB3_9MICC|nr:ECF RNA polymerase sigma factor SigL [Arthrobacter ulcerisalmonis]
MQRTLSDERRTGPTGHGMDAFNVRDAFAEHGSALYGFALNCTRDPAVAEECVQETFIRAWKARSRYESAKGTERTWLFAIARNVIIDEIRARERRPVPVPDSRMDVAATSRTGASAAEDRVVLQSGLALISEEHRDVIVAVQLNGLSYAELEQRTGVPAATLRTRMYYGLKALRRAIGEDEEGV